MTGTGDITPPGATVVSGCAYCRQFICRAAGSTDPWRLLPRPGQQLYPADAARCPAPASDGVHHPPDGSPALEPEPGVSLYDADSVAGRAGKLWHAVLAAHEGRPQAVYYRGQPYARIIPAGGA